MHTARVFRNTPLQERPWNVRLFILGAGGLRRRALPNSGVSLPTQAVADALHGASEMWTHDRNFVGLPGLRILDPLEL